MAEITYRDLTTLEDYGTVVELEREIWGVEYGDVVPVPILVVTVKRGGILIGAFDGTRLIGFVYSLPGLKEGAPVQWSHMLGVTASYRAAGIGRQLKLLQRARTLAMGLDLVEWTYDPLQAANAHFNFARLGVVVGEYEENIYGASSSPLHAGNPTDRFVAEWWIRGPHVERRLAGRAPSPVGSAGLAGAARLNRMHEAGGWLECADVDLAADARRLLVEIPTGFTEMMARAPALAREWRLATRAIFTGAFARGYRAVDFFLDREHRRGAYLLTSDVAP